MTSDDFFENWEQAKTILAEMAAEGVKPDGVTLMNLLVRGFSICYFSFSSQDSSRLELTVNRAVLSVLFMCSMHCSSHKI